jgi:hypothetical protein
MPTQNFTDAITCGLNTLSDSEIRVSVKDIENLSVLKAILKALISGELVLATPDRIIPEKELDKDEIKND